MTSSSAYYYTKVMSELFLHSSSHSGVSFHDISSMADFWNVSMVSPGLSTLLSMATCQALGMSDCGSGHMQSADGSGMREAGEAG